MIRNLDKTLVYANVATRRYEGEIRQYGDTVRINQVGDVSIATYTRNSTSVSPEELSDMQTELKIDQSNHFAFSIDDLDMAQAQGQDGVLAEGTRKGAYGLADTVDQRLAGLYASNGLAQNTNDSPVDMTSVNVEDEFLACAETMDENNIPREGRYAIIPPWAHTKLILAGITNLSQNNDTWVNGYIGRALGFNFYMSNNVSKNSSSWDKTRIMCGVAGETMAYAQQLLKIEAYRPEGSFSDAVKGLHLSGSKILRPDMGLTLYADKTAEA